MKLHKTMLCVRTVVWLALVLAGAYCFLLTSEASVEIMVRLTSFWRTAFGTPPRLVALLLTTVFWYPISLCVGYFASLLAKRKRVVWATITPMLSVAVFLAPSFLFEFKNFGDARGIFTLFGLLSLLGTASFGAVGGLGARVSRGTIGDVVA